MPSLERPRVEYRTPEDLVREVKRGAIRIPQFQRNFKWEAPDIVRLFDSIRQGYPVGNLLLWQRPAPPQHVQIGPLAVTAPAMATALWVVDGQQRITSLVGALTSAHDAADPRFRVHLDLDTGQFHTAGLRQQPPVSWIPVSLLLDTATLLKWMRENADWLTETQLDLADQAAKALREYQIPTYVVTADDEAPLLDIFTRMNTTGKRLTKSEVFQALHTGATEHSYASLTDLGHIPAETGFGTLDDRMTLRAVLAHLGGDVYREDFRGEFTTEESRIETFRDVAAALQEVVRFLQISAGIPHVKLLPYSHVIPVLVRFVKLHGAPEGRSATLLRRWVWRGAVAGTRARGISVADVRGQIGAVDAADPVTAAQQVLNQVQSFPDFTPEPDKIHFSHAMAKLNVLGLLSVAPRDLDSGAPVDIRQLLEQGSPLHTILSGKQDGPTDTIANRVVVPAAPSRQIRQQLATVSADIAASHLIDAEAQRLLAAGATDAFLERRTAAVAVAIRRQVSQMAEWGARDGQALSDVLRSVA
ncbi:DUF262 domain-containing protein [Micromonospora echinofusca]|uniref:DUF262 domain-containing protein n=1 Tax=Micromonospora echinofusca TaxID=47858 RepID=A0ABS3VQS1_MICEH|nr:DUF262 domain-containing protein [Micromonospora echinofusca]MBO4206733.1 DUF262 domain-containing protein [Micromonospora echinofusca]